MPRRKREYLPDHAYHIYQRGNNREPCFMDQHDYQRYLTLWEAASKRHAVAVHAYCLMTNHIHFLTTPSSREGLSRTLRDVGSNYATAINRKYKRTGTLWEGRHRSSLVHTERYFLTCMRYVELNPVRAGMVARPDEYRWSSFAANAWGEESWVTPHGEYLRLGESRPNRMAEYRKILQEQVPNEDLATIRKAAHYNQPVGSNRFRKMIEKQYGLKPGYINRGRPPLVLENDLNGEDG